MDGVPTFVNAQPNSQLVQQNLRELLDSHLPGQISRFEESSANLERVAAFCEANYIQSANKAESLAETKRYVLQSLASFAFLVGEVSRSLLDSLELESVNLAEKSSQIRNISQLVAIQKEKSARREIGKLTASKNVIRLNKITYPSSEERTPRYQRTPIDFSILDGIGHGKRIAKPTNDYGTIGASHRQTAYGQITLNRTGSMVGSGRTSTGNVQKQQPIYDHYAKANYGTLSRGSSLLPPSAVSSPHDQYRVPMPIPSSVVPPPQQPFVRSAVHYSQHFPAAHYASHHHHRQHSISRGDEMTDNPLAGRGSAAPNGRCQQNHHGNADSGQYADEQAQQHYEQIGGRMTLANGATIHQDIRNNLNNELQPHNSNNRDGPMNNSADFSDDGLPLPPPLLLSSNTVPSTDQHGRFSHIQQQEDVLQPAPLLTRPGLNSAVGGDLPNWTPSQFIEKAVVLYDYDSQNPDELHLYQGALVYVLRKNEDGWFEGVMDGLTGLFPSNYVQPFQ